MGYKYIFYDTPKKGWRIHPDFKKVLDESLGFRIRLGKYNTEEQAASALGRFASRFHFSTFSCEQDRDRCLIMFCSTCGASQDVPQSPRGDL
jgi:hypothetical protein